MSEERIIIGLTVIVVLGVGAQWVAKRRDFPALLLLLPAGLFAGNVGGIVEPEEMFGDMLFPGVTMLVGLLLFHSGLQLRFADLRGGARSPVIRLSTVAAMLTLVGAAAAVWLVLRPSGQLALLTGAILVVSGPTVVGPLLDTVRPREPIGSILRWEGTVLDPIGATMGVIALNLVLASERHGVHPMLQMGARLALGVGVGLLAGALLVFVMSRFLVTDQMEAAVALLFAVAAFGAAELVLTEAGLFATVTLGLVVANQSVVPIERISGFGETLEVLIIGSLFVVLGALVDVSELLARGWRIAALVALLVVVVRPLSVGLSMIGTAVDPAGRAMIAWLDPRGVVAASTAAAFAGTLASNGIEADFLSPVVFGVILGTGVTYGLSAAPAASMLGLRSDPPNGVLVLGAQEWLVDLARCLDALGVNVLVAVPGYGESAEEPIPGTVLAMEDLVGEETLRATLAAENVGRAVVVPSRDMHLRVIVAALVEVLGRRRVYRVRSADLGSVERTMLSASTAVAFRSDVTDAGITGAIETGSRITELSYEEALGADSPLVMAVVDPDGTVHLGEASTNPHGATRGARFVGLAAPLR